MTHTLEQLSYATLKWTYKLDLLCNKELWDVALTLHHLFCFKRAAILHYLYYPIPFIQGLAFYPRSKYTFHSFVETDVRGSFDICHSSDLFCFSKISFSEGDCSYYAFIRQGEDLLFLKIICLRDIMTIFVTRDSFHALSVRYHTRLSIDLTE